MQFDNTLMNMNMMKMMKMKMTMEMLMMMMMKVGEDDGYLVMKLSRD